MPPMKTYKNLNGNSGVKAFEIGDHSIAIRFNNGETYLYDHNVPGKKEVAQMKRLALAGKGLSTFISQSVRERYAAKLS